MVSTGPFWEEAGRLCGGREEISEEAALAASLEELSGAAEEDEKLAAGTAELSEFRLPE